MVGHRLKKEKGQERKEESRQTEEGHDDICNASITRSGREAQVSCYMELHSQHDKIGYLASRYGGMLDVKIWLTEY